MLNFFLGEKMDDEPANFVHIFSSVDARAIMGIPCVPDCVDIDSIGLQNSSHFLREKFKFMGSEGHAIEHMGVAAIEELIFKGKALPNIATQDRNRI